MNNNYTNFKLSQKSRYEFRSFEILEKGVLVEYRLEGDYAKYEVPFENIDFKEIIRYDKPSLFAILFLFSLIINVVIIFAFLAVNYGDGTIFEPLFNGLQIGIMITVISIFLPILSTNYTKEIKGIQSIVFSYKKKQQKEVNEFIKKLKEVKSQYILNEIAIVDDLIPIDNQKFNFLYLYESNQISRQEYENLLEELEKLRIIKGE